MGGQAIAGGRERAAGCRSHALAMVRRARATMSTLPATTDLMIASHLAGVVSPPILGAPE
jgi:hypothetical protein